MLTPPGTTDALARDRQQQRLGGAAAFRARPRRVAPDAGRLRRLMTAITSIIA